MRVSSRPSSVWIGAIRSVYLMKRLPTGRLRPSARLRAHSIGFIERVYRTTAVVSLIAGLAILGYFGWASVASYLLGALLGAGLMRLLEHTVDLGIRAVVRDGKANGSGRAIIVGLSALKYLVIAVGLYLLVTQGWVRLWCLLAGYGTIYIVIVLKVVGRLLLRSCSEFADVATDASSGGSRGL